MCDVKKSQGVLVEFTQDFLKQGENRDQVKVPISSLDMKKGKHIYIMISSIPNYPLIIICRF